MRVDMQKELDKLLNAGEITLVDKTTILEAMDARMYGPIDSKVKVTLLSDIRFLAASVSPLTPTDDFAGIIPRAKKAFERFLVNSPGIYTEEELSFDEVRGEACFISSTIADVCRGKCSIYSCRPRRVPGGFWMPRRFLEGVTPYPYGTVVRLTL